MNFKTSAEAGLEAVKVPVENPKRIFKPNSIGLRLTYRCNAKCEHCYCFTDKDEASEEMLKLEEIIPLINEAKRIRMTGVGVSGGEPFLHRRMVLEITSLAKQERLNVNLATNAFWAKHYDKAVNILEQLKALGFRPPQDSIAVSAGQYHLPHISRECSKNLI